MKKIRLQTLMLITAITALTFGFTSCVSEGCTNPLAENYDANADEDDGSCSFARDEFLGEYAVSETCESGDWSYDLVVTPLDGTDDKIVLGNLGGWESPANVVATVSGNNISFNDFQNGINFSGSGTISGNTLTITYVATAGTNTDACTAICLRS